MNLYPAIDLKEGRCVRLLRGEMDKATVFDKSPADQAKQFEAAGFSWLHVVDLNGAFEGKPINEQAVKSIRSSVRMKLQLGGGIRTLDQIDSWLSLGISRVILGTIALKNPPLVKEACKLFPGKIAVGIDARDGYVAVEGWAEVSDIKAAQLARKFEDAGVAAIIYTDISRDGAMQGSNVAETVTLAKQISIPIIASGGVSSLADIRAYKEQAASGIDGVIIGRALYDGAIDPAEALAVAGG
jgi:phosphoribosylformimino-5-aminoimidazole carboxamide ribotide isomerase